MSIIGGVGNYSGVSLSGFRGKQNEQQDEQALVTREVGKTVRTANAESEREFQARQATEEGFARLHTFPSLAVAKAKGNTNTHTCTHGQRTDRQTDRQTDSQINQ